MDHRKSRVLPILALGLLLAAPAVFGSPVIKIKVTAEIANIRVRPFIGSNIVRQFPEGAILEAELKEGEWFLVNIEPDETGTTSGYVHESLVLPLEELPVTAPKAEPKVEPKVEPKIEPEIVPPPVEEIKDVPKKPARPAAVPAPKAGDAAPAEAKPTVYEATREILAAAAAESPFYIFLWGGGGMTAVGDLNAGAEGLADYYAAQINRTADAEVAPARYGTQFGGEVGLTILPRLRLAVGAEYIRAGKESALAFPGATDVPASFTAKPSFTALPVHATVAYYPLDFFYLKAGIGYCFARANYRYVFTHGAVLRDWEGEAEAGGMAVLGGIGLDLSLGRHFCLAAELSGRYARIPGFSGTNTYRDEDSVEPYLESGGLYAFDVRSSSRTAFPMVFIRDGIPLESGVENAREAILDLSGVSLRLGLKYRF